MNRRLDNKIKKTFKECETFTQFESERLLYSDELRRYSLEFLSYVGLKVSPLYGEKKELLNQVASSRPVNDSIFRTDLERIRLDPTGLMSRLFI